MNETAKTDTKIRISGMRWFGIVVLAFLCAGNINSGDAFVLPDSGHAIGLDIFSICLWGGLLWALWPVFQRLRGLLVRDRIPAK